MQLGLRFALGFVVANLVWLGISTVVLGRTATVVSSGSMTPSLHRGDVVLLTPNDPGEPYRHGEVVQFRDPSGVDVIHRIVDVASDGAYVTKGDANRTVDSWPVPGSAIRGRATGVIPYLGHPWVVIAACVGAAAAISARWARRGHRRMQPPEERNPDHEV